MPLQRLILSLAMLAVVAMILAPLVAVAARALAWAVKGRRCAITWRWARTR